MLRIGTVLLCLLLLPFSARAQDSCGTAVNVPVHVTPVFDEPKYNFTTGINDIQHIATDASHSIHESLALGVTHYESILEFKTPVVTVTFSNGASCTSVQNAFVTIGYTNVTVYIAREVPQDSCGFSEVMAHEQKHIAVNRQVLNEFAPRIRDSLAAYLKSHAIFRGQDRNVEIARLQQNLQSLLSDLGARMMSENVARQKQIDSVAEYTRLSHVCDGQLAAIAGRSLGAYR